MTSIRTRLTVYFASSATATLAILFAIGYLLLQAHMQNELDRLIDGYYQEIKIRLGDIRHLDHAALNRRIRQTSEYFSTLFYIEIEIPNTKVDFSSANLHGREIPEVRGDHAADVVIPGVGPARTRALSLGALEVTVATPLAPLRRVMTSYVRACFVLLLAMFALSVGIGSGLSRLVLDPIRVISRTANRIRSDNLSERIALDHVADEISDLVRLLNAMFDRLETAFDQVRRFSDEASHELKTPLSLVRLHAEKMLRDGRLVAAHEEAVVEQLDEIDRLNKIIDELLFLSRAEAEAISLVLVDRDPSQLLENFAQDAVALCEHHGCRFVYEHDGAGETKVQENWIRQVLLNVLTNAVHASPRGGTIALRSIVQGNRWELSIEDEGPGLDAVQRSRMFERFVRFSAGEDGDRGSGLGLTICRKIVELHGGRMFATERAGQTGLRVVVQLPAFAHRHVPQAVSLR